MFYICVFYLFILLVRETDVRKTPTSSQFIFFNGKCLKKGGGSIQANNLQRYFSGRIQSCVKLSENSYGGVGSTNEVKVGCVLVPRTGDPVSTGTASHSSVQVLSVLKEHVMACVEFKVTCLTHWYVPSLTEHVIPVSSIVFSGVYRAGTYVMQVLCWKRLWCVTTLLVYFC